MLFALSTCWKARVVAQTRMRAGLAGLLAPLLAAFVTVRGDDSCPAGGGASGCRGSSPLGGTARLSGTYTAAAVPTSDLISQEVEELQEIIKLSEERIIILKEFRESASSGRGVPLHEVQARALTEKLPLISEVAKDTDRTPVAAAEDYLVTKAIVPLDEAANFIRFMPLKASRGGSSGKSVALPASLLVAVQSDGMTRIFTPMGELVLSFSAGHEYPVTQLAVTSMQEDNIVATSDDRGTMRMHKVTIRPRRPVKDTRGNSPSSSNDKPSSYLNAGAFNVTVNLLKQAQVPMEGDGQPPRITAMAVVSQQGVRYVVVGDDHGRLHTFGRNGSLHGVIDDVVPKGSGIRGLHQSANHVFYYSSTVFGYLELERQEVKHAVCPKFEGSIAALTVDSQHVARVLLADTLGQVWVFNLKNKKECKFEHKFPAILSSHARTDLASIHGYVLGLERQHHGQASASYMALNLSHVGAIGRKKSADPVDQPLVWRRTRGPVRDWSVHRRSYQGDLMAFLSEDGREIEIMELIMKAEILSGEKDTMSNFKLPVMGVAIVLVLGYQYMKRGGKLPIGGKSAAGVKDIAAALKNKRKLGPVGKGRF